MPSIRHRISVDAPIDEVYSAIAKPEGISQWWTRDTEGDDTVGGHISFSFGGPEPAATVELVELDRPRRVEWRVVQGPDEWLDTTVTFDLKREDDQTIVLFTHAGWAEPVEFLHHCSSRWAYFLFSLKHGYEGGKATPWPSDEKIDNWS
jgi:uncharacterized protein YndB with AHSA1/START domain